VASIEQFEYKIYEEERLIKPFFLV